MELSIKLRRGLPAGSHWWVEQREARRLLRTLGQPITADVVTIVPTFRRPRLLEQAVGSALAQPIDDHHVVVVDDGGGDIPEFAEPRVTVLRLSRNTGCAGLVRNVGIRCSASRYVAFLDDDNRWRPDHLPTALRGLTEGVDLVYTGLRRAWPDGREVDALTVPFNRDLLRRWSYVDTSAIVVRRRERLRFSRLHRGLGTVPGEDWEFVFRLTRRGEARYLDRITVDYLVHTGSYFTDWLSSEVTWHTRPGGNPEAPVLSHEIDDPDLQP